MPQTRERRMYLYWRAMKYDRDVLSSQRLMMVAVRFGVPIREVREIVDAQKGVG